MDVSLLSAAVQLSKSFSLDSHGQLVKTPYPQVRNFTSRTVPISSLVEFHSLLTTAAGKGECLLKGRLLHPLVNESRAGSTSSNDATEWLCLDLDGLGDNATPDSFMASINMADVSYVLQYSASHGVDLARGLSAHIYVLLERDLTAPFLKQVLIHWNLNSSLLTGRIRLTRTHCSLRWPLDITTCQNDKLLYIADPVLQQGVKCKLKGPRILLVKRELERVPASRLTANIASNAVRQTELITSLRAEAGLPAIKSTQHKSRGGLLWLSKPGQAVITGIKQERGFVYFNLNGGDSWAYFHPENDPHWIHNFKGEPVYATEELLPEYWKEINERASRTKTKMESDDKRVFFVCRDFKTDRFYNGVFNPATNALEMARAQNEARLHSFLMTHNRPIPEFIPDWDISFDPHTTVRFDPAAKRINTYVPSEFTKLPLKQVKTLPGIIKTVMLSSVGEECLHPFLNWLAYILQFKEKTGTAWVLHGIQGTGKGILYARIIAPLLGASNTALIAMRALEERFNPWIENSLVVFVDEVQVSKLINSDVTMADLRTYITERVVPIRRMYTDMYNARNYSNFILASNKPDPVDIDPTDRRFSVGNYGAKKLELTDDDLIAIDKALPDLYHYLMALEVDEAAARTPVRTATREQLMSVSWSSAEEVAYALKQGNMEFLLEQLPDSNEPTLLTPTVLAYRSLMLDLLHERRERLTRDELFLIFDHTVGGVPRSPHKFTKYLRHRHIFTRRLRIDDRLHYGMEIIWQQDEMWFARMLKLISPEKPAKRSIPLSSSKSRD